MKSRPEELVQPTNEEYFEFWIAKGTRFDGGIVDAIEHQRWVSSYMAPKIEFVHI